MKDVTVDKRGFKYYLGSLIAVIVILTFGRIVPAWSSVTVVGVSCLGILLGMIIAIICTGEVLWPTMFSMVALTLYGYYPSFDAAIRDIFGNPLVYNFFLITALITAMNEIGTGKAIASLILTRKVFQNKPVLLSFAFLMTFVIAVNFMNAIGCMLLAFPLLDAVLGYIGIGKKEKYAKFMNLGLFLAISMGVTLRGAVMPDYLVRVEFFNAALSETGISVHLGLYTVFCVFTVTAFFVAYVMAMKYVFHCDFGKLSNTDFREIEEIMKDAKLDRFQFAFLFGFLLFALFGIISKAWKNASLIGQYGALGVVCAFLSFLKYVDKNGKKTKLFDFAQFLQRVNWNIAISLGIFSVLGTAIGSDECGIKAWITNEVANLLHDNGALILALVCIIGVSSITHVFNNNATATIFASLMAPITAQFVVRGQMKPELILACIAICSQSGFMTIAACGAAPILYNREGIDNRFIWTDGLTMEVLLMTVVILMYLLFSMF